MDTHTLMWLFPIAFMLHDFEEIILSEPWLKKNAGEIKDRIKNKVPDFVARQIGAALDKSANELAFPVSLIFSLTFIATFLAVTYGKYGFFLLATGSFFLHGFMHVGQAIILRRYIPAVISSVLFAMPYGAVLYWRLIQEGVINLPGLLIYFLVAVVLTIPFILVMHVVGDWLYKTAVRVLVG